MQRVKQRKKIVFRNLAIDRHLRRVAGLVPFVVSPLQLIVQPGILAGNVQAVGI